MKPAGTRLWRAVIVAVVMTATLAVAGTAPASAAIRRPVTGARPGIDGGGNHNCVVQGAGTVKCWGSNGYGQLGNGTNTDAHTVVPVAGQSSAIAVAGGGAQGYAADADGSVWAWGYNFNGQLGTGNSTTTNVPVQIPGLSNVTALAALMNGAMALRTDGTVWAWSTNAYGQLGDGTTNPHLTPVQVPGLTSVVAIAAGDFSAYALRSDGTALAPVRDGQCKGCGLRVLPHTLQLLVQDHDDDEVFRCESCGLILYSLSRRGTERLAWLRSPGEKT